MEVRQSFLKALVDQFQFPIEHFGVRDEDHLHVREFRAATQFDPHLERIRHRSGEPSYLSRVTNRGALRSRLR